MSLIEKLRAINKKLGNQTISNEDIEEKVEKEFKKIYYKSNDHNNYTIPKFYHKLPSEEDALAQKLRDEARALFLEKKNKEILGNDELHELYIIMHQHQSEPQLSNEAYLNYKDFLKVKEEVVEKCQMFFTPKVFAKLLQNDPYGRIKLINLFNYIMRKVWFNHTRIGLSLYDVNGQGYLKERELESYISELIPTLHQMKDLEKSFYSFYNCTAVRKFFFFLDPMKTNKVKIQDILCCSFLNDLLDLRSEEPSKESQDSNWFSASSALRVYGQYLNLDKDHNGMLSKEELACYGTGQLTKVFIDRVFQECLTYEGEMDYKTYLDFVLALENKKEPQALQYFFRILDIDGKGYLNVFSLNYFFRAIQEQLRQNKQDFIQFEDVKDEIFDMVNPSDLTRITFQDLLNCGKCDTVINILIDVNGFWTYENREVIAANVSDEASV